MPKHITCILKSLDMVLLLSLLSLLSKPLTFVIFRYLCVSTYCNVCISFLYGYFFDEDIIRDRVK